MPRNKLIQRPETRLRLTSRLARWSAIAATLAAPLVAMQFTDEVAWTAFDFAFAAALLVGAGLIYEAAALKARRPLPRAIIGGVLIAVVAVIWAQGAVGIF